MTGISAIQTTTLLIQREDPSSRRSANKTWGDKIKQKVCGLHSNAAAFQAVKILRKGGSHAKKQRGHEDGLPKLPRKAGREKFKKIPKYYEISEEKAHIAAE